MNPVSSAELPKRKNFYQHAATFCLLGPFIGYAVLMATLWCLGRPQSRLGTIINVVIEAAPLLVGSLSFIFGIIALFGIRRHGATGILGKVLAGFLVFLLVGIPSSQNMHRWLVEISWQPPVMLAQKIATSDRVIISREQYEVVETNHMATTREWREELSSKTGDEAKQIINAVSLARKDVGTYGCIFGERLEFYQGTNLLATVRWQGRLFLTGEEQFSDNSGMLNALYDKSSMR